MIPLFVLAHFSHHVIAALLQPLLPFIRDDFALSYTQAAWLVSAFTLSYGISNLPAGWLADRVGSRLIIAVGVTGAAICGLIVGLSPTYTIMVIFLVLLGITGGGYHPAASPLISASVEPQNRGRALGLHQIGGTASFFLAPLIAVGITSILNWRSTFVVVAIPVIIVGIVMYIVIGKRGYSDRTGTKSEASHLEGPITTSSHWTHLVAFITLGVTLQVLLFSLISFLPLFTVDHFGASEGVAASLLSLYHLTGLLGGPLGGYLSDRVGEVPVMLTACLLAGPFVYIWGLVSFGWQFFLIIFTLGFFQYVGMPASEAYIISHAPQRYRSTALGIYYSASRGGPGLIMPVLGFLFDQYGFNASFTIVGSALFAIAIICSILLLRNRS
ncbi:MFS transporter [Chloroflexota bacterium]